MNRKWLIALILFILLASGLFPAPAADEALAATGNVEITGSTVNIRSGPGLSYSVSGSLAKGEKVSVVSQSGDWLEVKADGEQGWIASWLAASAEAGNAEAEVAGKTAVSAVDRLNVRSQPDLSASVLGQMNAGDQAAVISEAGEWIEVDFRNTRGFVSKQYISTSEQTAEKPAPATSSVSSFEIVVDALNVREKPDLSSSVEATVQKGEVFTVESMDGNWVEIRISSDQTGWVYAFHGHLSDQSAQAVEKTSAESGNTVTVITNGTNLRAEPSTASSVVSRADAGDELAVVQQNGDWYQVSLPDGSSAYIATWVVTSDETAAEESEEKEQPARKKGTLNGLTIVLDPGHGGNDGGTVGARKTKEKDLTLQTAETLSHHLRSAGADVILTRQSDTYVDLRKRVSVGHQVAADAFISLHYDATEDNSVSGFTAYYMHDFQEPLAEAINTGLSRKIDLRNRGVQQGNYLVLRENHQPAVLIELGYLSNYNDERIVTATKFQEQAALGLYTGIVNYFDGQAE
ncbi:SH3 domain-containing protein [Planococcus shenhongbingii]|uniref:SH3 domain-containing protein n=1 Tax=Planococcus shenhongbingii TaxID=3058398 RepID=A0ABT8ND80_9BACL|nr:SH3 domain-containing protein [Planococcus sp. N017]MDN7245847.1 SH3 domain-containing protein [Planococcus sp. N017]